ncbi:MAG: LCP family protein, partial [Lactococcus sp.]
GISSYYYVLTQNSSISQEIDNVFPDGLQLDFPSPVKVSNGKQIFSFSMGTHQLSGEALAAYMKADAVTTSSSLLTQVNRQQEVLSALIEQLQKQNSVQKNSSKTMETLLSFTSNNLTPDFSSQLLTELLASSNVKVKTLIAPVSADTKLVTSKTSLQNLQITNEKDNRQRIADFLNQ